MMLIQKLMSQGMGQEEAMQVAQQMMAQAEQQQMAPQGMPPQGMPPRQMAAFGGIMGMDGRREYGLGSSLKKRIRKLIPNEVAKVAEVAAPFVAPFNPLAAGLMSGIGGFDRTGKIGSSIKSGLMNYGMGQAARYVGGADFQGGFDPRGGFTPGTAGTGKFSQYFSKPTGSGGIKNLFNKSTPITNNIKTNGIPDLSGKELMKAGTEYYDNPALQAKYGSVRDYQNFIASQQAPNLNFLDKAVSTFTNMSPLAQGAIGAGAITALLNMGPDETVDEIMDRGEGLDIAGIRAEVTEAFKDQTGEKLSALRVKYPYLGTQRSKNQAAMAMGGRIGYMGGGMTMGDPRMMAPQSRMPAAEGGLMDLGGMEKDYRAEGGFVPIGAKEKADDVPARLSVNEFVFTADAVRSAGGGDIDRGAEVMENMMKNLEQGGQVSEESQGMSGAQQMFETSERLSEVV